MIIKNLVNRTVISDGDTRLIRNVGWVKTPEGSKRLEPKSYDCPFCGEAKVKWGHIPDCREKKQRPA